MKFRIKNQFAENEVNLLRRCGYRPHYDPRSGQSSFTRSLGRGFYPRFHLYLVLDEEGDFIFNLHLDAKRPSYSDQHAHSAEYDSELVKQEAERIKGVLGMSNI